jgi:hypothetical protein
MNKLFTEEQVRIMISEARFIDYEDQHLYTDDYLIEQQIAIELPTDEEIYELAEKILAVDYLSFTEGAKWMRDKIKGGQDE